MRLLPILFLIGCEGSVSFEILDVDTDQIETDAPTLETDEPVDTNLPCVLERTRPPPGSNPSGFLGVELLSDDVIHIEYAEQMIVRVRLFAECQPMNVRAFWFQMLADSDDIMDVLYDFESDPSAALMFVDGVADRELRHTLPVTGYQRVDTNAGDIRNITGTLTYAFARQPIPGVEPSRQLILSSPFVITPGEDVDLTFAFPIAQHHLALLGGQVVPMTAAFQFEPHGGPEMEVPYSASRTAIVRAYDTRGEDY